MSDGEVQVPLDELSPEEQLEKVLAALEDKNPAAADALIEHRSRAGVPCPENSTWSHGSGWDVNPERRRGDPA